MRKPAATVLLQKIRQTRNALGSVAGVEEGNLASSGWNRVAVRERLERRGQNREPELFARCTDDDSTPGSSGRSFLDLSGESTGAAGFRKGTRQNFDPFRNILKPDCHFLASPGPPRSNVFSGMAWNPLALVTHKLEQVQLLPCVSSMSAGDTAFRHSSCMPLVLCSQRDRASWRLPGARSFSKKGQRRREREEEEAKDFKKAHGYEMPKELLEERAKMQAKAATELEEELDIPKLEMMVENWAKMFGDHQFTAVLRLRLAQAYFNGGFDGEKVFETAHVAWQYMSTNPRPNDLALVMCLHVMAGGLNRMGQGEEAMRHLKEALELLAKDRREETPMLQFATHTMMGDTWTNLSRHQDAVASYRTALELHMAELGDSDPRVGVTLRQLAEAHMQLMEFASAEPIALKALDIHRAASENSVDEAVDRRLLASIYAGLDDPARALSHLEVVRAILSGRHEGLDASLADAMIGEMLSKLGKDEEAAQAYRAALAVQVEVLGREDEMVAGTCVSAADAFFRAGKLDEAEKMSSMALEIYQKVPNETPVVASGLSELAAAYEIAEKPEQALALFLRALKIFEALPGELLNAAGVETQAGCLLLTMGRYDEALLHFNSCLPRLQEVYGAASATVARVHVYIALALTEAGRDDEARAVLALAAREALPPGDKPDPAYMDVYHSLAGLHQALGSYEEEVNYMRHVVTLQEASYGQFNHGTQEAKEQLEEALRRLQKEHAKDKEGLQ